MVDLQIGLILGLDNGMVRSVLCAPSFFFVRNSSLASLKLMAPFRTHVLGFKMQRQPFSSNAKCSQQFTLSKNIIFHYEDKFQAKLHVQSET